MVRPAAPFWRCLLAGVAAGVVAALGCAVVAALVVPAPPRTIAVGSALTAGVLAGPLYWLLARATRRPAAALWLVVLLLATAVSAVVRWLPPAFLPLPRYLTFLNGLAAPAGQVLTALGILHRHRPPGLPRPGGAAGGRTSAGGAGRPGPGGPAGSAQLRRVRGSLLDAQITMHYVVAAAAGVVVPWVAGRRRRSGARAA